MLKRLAIALGTLCVLMAAAVALLAMSLPQGHALVQPGPAPRPSEALREVKSLATRDVMAQALHGAPLPVEVPLPDLSSVLQEVSGRWLQGGAKVQSTPQGQLEWLASVPIEQTPLRPLAPLGAWLNLKITIGLHTAAAPTLDDVKVGRLNLPGTPLLWLVRQVLASQNLLEPAELLVSAIEHSEVSNGRLKLTLHWTPVLQGRTLALLIPKEDWPILMAQHQRVQETLRRVPLNMRVDPGFPVREVMRSVFILAQQRTFAAALTVVKETDENSSQQRAYRETRAALVAVALAANHLSLHRVLPVLDSQATPPLVPVSLRMLGREDFAQHYTISALTSLMLGSRVSNTIGLYKELMDANKQDGGSGFSFNDLALNQAGIRLGQHARQDPIALLQRLGGETALVQDHDFIPDVDDLPEFLDRPTFVHRYGGIKDPRFISEMHKIDARVSALPVLQ